MVYSSESRGSWQKTLPQILGVIQSITDHVSTPAYHFSPCRQSTGILRDTSTASTSNSLSLGHFFPSPGITGTGATLEGKNPAVPTRL